MGNIKSPQFIKTQKSIIVLLFFYVLLFNNSIFAQTIPATNTVTTCINCVPSGWFGVFGSTDISNSTYWAGNTSNPWAGVVINPPNGHTTWVTGVTTEMSGTTITGLTVGETYNFKFYAAELINPAIGGTNNNYDGALGIYNSTNTLLSSYNFTGGASNDWNLFTYSFTATSTSMQLRFRYAVPPGLNSNFWNISFGANAVAALDSDNDGITDSVDIDDDNDGILDIIELGCGISSATINTANTITTSGSQHFEGVFTNGSSIIDFNVNFQNLSTLSTSNLYDGTSGMHYIIDDSNMTYSTTFSLTPQTNSLINKIRWGPDLINNTDAENDNDEQTIVLTWTTPITVKVFDPDNQLDINGSVNAADTNGVIISSGNSIFQRAEFENASKPTWYVEFQGNLLATGFTFTADHSSIAGSFQNEGFSVTTDTCYLVNTDGTGQPNYLDLDSDNDDCSDALEAGATTNLTADFQFTSADANNNGLIDVVEDGTTGNINYASTYNQAISNTIKACTDTDGDGILDSTDIDDDNDGILDSVELDCGIGKAIIDVSSVITSSGSQYFEGDYTNNSSKVDFNVGFQNLSTLSTSNLYYGASGIHYVIDDSNATYSTTISLTPQTSSLINKINWGPDLIGNADSENDNDIQTIVLTWSPSIVAKVFDPDNQLDINGSVNATDTNGVIISSGNSIFQRAEFENASKPTWYVEFQGNFLTSGFTLTANHTSVTGDLRNEGFSLTTDICYLVNTDGTGEANYLDLDSDDDGCSDALEAGATTNLTTNFQFTGVDANSNGLIDTVEDGTIGNINYTSTYDQAISDAIKACIDTDGDGVFDFIDIDDDNDGILDTDECSFTPVSSDTSLDFSSDADGAFETLAFVAGSDGAGNGNVSANNSGWGRTNTPDSWVSPVPITGSGQFSGHADGMPSSPDGGVFIAAFFTPFSTLEVIQTTITGLTIGQVYKVKFYQANAGVEGETPININQKARWEVTFGSETFYSTAMDYKGESNQIWMEESITFIATATSQALIFTPDSDGTIAATPSNREYMALDGVRIFEESTSYSCTEDTDGDGIPDHLDLDSDGDGCPDVVESAVPTALKAANVTNGGPGVVTYIANAVIDISLDPVGANGYANSLENIDTNAATIINAHTTTNYTIYASDNTKNGCGTAMITQLYQSNSDQWIEITNIDASNVVVPNAATLALYRNISPGDNQLGITPDATIINTSEILPNTTIIFKNSTATLTNIHSGATSISDNNITNFDGGDDILILSKSATSSAWLGRVDVLKNFTNNTSYVRTDEITTANKMYTISEWVAFVDDAIITYDDVANDNATERHLHDPLISEINTANIEANAQLGLHRFGSTSRIGGAWSNGYPDRSRHVKISETYNHTSKFSARKLDILNNSVFSITDNLLIVTNNINIATANDEIRLISSDNTNKSQLIQTHQNTNLVTGNGKFAMDQNSTIPSTYRYNYLSSPVNTTGVNTFKVSDVLKDGTTPLNTSGTIGNDVAKNINFINNSYDGSPTNPITIADHWIYTYASANGTRSNWQHKYSTGVILQTDGFIMKGPNRAQNYTFLGTPKDGDLTTAVGGNESYLVGNPYPSALSAKKFIQDNLNSTTGTLYFWEHAGEKDTNTSATSGHNYAGYIGGYATRNIAMGLAANQVTTNNTTDDGIPSIGNGSYKVPGPYIAIAQGFFISGDTDGGTITFNNSQRANIPEGASSIFYKGSHNTSKKQNESTSSLPILKLGMDYTNSENKKIHRQIGISFKNGNSFSYDKGYDSEIFDIGKTDLYWKFSNDDKKYVIAGIQEITNDLVIPLHLVIDYDGAVSITIDEWQHINKEVYIKDQLTNKSYLISDGKKATINLSKGTYKHRFAVTFKENTLSTDEITPTTNYILAHYNKELNQIIIKSNTNIDTVELYNMLGQSLQKWNHLESSKEIHLTPKNLRANIYFLRVKIQHQNIYKKIAIYPN